MPKTLQKKLGATIDTKNKAHDIARVHHEGVLVAAFGIRRGSNRNQGHGHIPGDLHLSRRKTLELARCTLSAEDWIKGLVADGWIEGESENKSKETDTQDAGDSE